MQTTTIKPQSHEEIVCDFCSTPHGPFWAYEAEDFVLDAGETATLYGSAGAWGACDKCRVDIDRDNRRALLVRAIGAMSKAMPTTPLDIIETALRQAHESFFNHRLPGGPTLVQRPVGYA